jgi:chloramphenicol-sensitive protein RarD
MTDISHSDSSPPVPGVVLGICAFLIWGLSPVYWKALKHISPVELLMHRIFWSFVFLTPFLFAKGLWRDYRILLTSRRGRISLAATPVLLFTNWFLFIYAINTDRILQVSLGYYITPLVNVFLGMVILKERLRPMQYAALGLAITGVLYLTFRYDSFPGIALYLAFTFGFYGLIRKTAPYGAVFGLWAETLILSVPALMYLIYLEYNSFGSFFHAGMKGSLLLMGSSLITGLPLLLFTLAARRIHLSTVGFLQYIAPSCTFLLAVFVYREPFSKDQLVAFVLIWTALTLYSIDSLRFHHFGKGKTRINALYPAIIKKDKTIS